MLSHCKPVSRTLHASTRTNERGAFKDLPESQRATNARHCGVCYFGAAILCWLWRYYCMGLNIIAVLLPLNSAFGFSLVSTHWANAHPSTPYVSDSRPRYVTVPASDLDRQSASDAIILSGVSGVVWLSRRALGFPECNAYQRRHWQGALDQRAIEGDTARCPRLLEVHKCLRRRHDCDGPPWRTLKPAAIRRFDLQ